MKINYVVIDIETCPIDLEAYSKLEEEDKKKFLNPIDSRIVAIGLRFKGEDFIFMNEDEKFMLNEFWEKLREIEKTQVGLKFVGFNIKNFDLPFLTTRSFVHNVWIVPFILKSVIDVREKVNAHRYGKSRGTLKEYAMYLGLEDIGMDGSMVADLCVKKDYDTLKKYLKNDLLISDKMFERIVETGIVHIAMW